MENFSEFNAEDYADNQEAPLEELFNHLDHFINYLQYDNINIDQFLSAGTTLIKRDKNPPRGKSIEGIEYSIPPDTDFHKWVQEFEKSTGALYIKCQIFHNEGNVSLRVIYKCHRAVTYQSIAGKDQSIKEPQPNQNQAKNVTKEAIVDNQMKHKSEAQSIELWRIELNQKNDLTCAIPKAE
ncbi:11048_t:CDS:2, partial [Racocetra persica]